MPAGTCSRCGSEDTGRSPTGSWCNDCGWAYPGYRCENCGRAPVNERHLDPDGEPCETTEQEPYA